MEEQFVLRVFPELAERLQRILAGKNAQSDVLALSFAEDGCTGRLLVGCDDYECTVQRLPTHVESWKTLDDTNLVKAADVSQVIVVTAPGQPRPTVNVSVNGLTPAMRDAQRTHFRRGPAVDAARITALEVHLSALVTGGAHHLPGETEVSYEEVWSATPG